MIERTFQKGDAASSALYSDCMSYRYELTRVWNAAGRRVLFILLNPSTATEHKNDPTVERCERRARGLGFGGFRVCNIFGYRATDPQALRRCAEPIGGANDAALLRGCGWADKVICGWGVHGGYLGRGLAVEARLRVEGFELWCLGVTREGAPRHPLYIGYGVAPMVWEAEGVNPAR